MQQKVSKQKTISGFTLYEVMVSVAIIAILSAVSFYSLSSYADYFTLKEASRGIDSLLRTTQGYAINIQNIDGDDQYVGRYGLRFSTNTKTETILFSDNNLENFMYNGGSEYIQKTTLGRGVELSKICYLTTTNATENCSVTDLDVVFVRPRPDANVRINSQNIANVKEIRLEYLSPKGRVANVVFGVKGYITNN